MTKRKLRNCSQCGVRHGPPFGKYCNRLEDAFNKLNQEMDGVAAAAASGGDAERPEAGDLLEKGSVAELSTGILEEDGTDSEIELEKHDLAEFEKFGGASLTSPSPWQPDAVFEDRREPAQVKLPATGMGGRAKSSRRKQPPPFIEREEVIGRLDRLENVVGKVCGVYQATMERFADFASAPQARPKQPPPPEESAAPVAPAEPTPKATVQGSASTEKVSKFEWGGFDMESTNGDAWADYHGREMWKAAEERKKKNPFNHVAYVKKGDKIESFELLMVVTFKTIQQLMDAKYDVTGLVKHGLMMAEKASKKVFEVEAFLLYDESVRERAGETGPTAFGQVNQEDSLRFFSAENMRKASYKAKPTASPGSQLKKRSDKLCIRYNDGGCSSKSCFFVHKCVACGDASHGAKECKSKKKEGK